MEGKFEEDVGASHAAAEFNRKGNTPHWLKRACQSGEMALTLATAVSGTVPTRKVSDNASLNFIFGRCP